MKCKNGHETSERWCGKCGLKMPLGPGDRCLEQAERNLQSNQKAEKLLGAEPNHGVNPDEWVADLERVKTRVQNYTEEVAWLKRMIAGDVAAVTMSAGEVVLTPAEKTARKKAKADAESNLDA